MSYPEDGLEDVLPRTPDPEILIESFSHSDIKEKTQYGSKDNDGKKGD